MLLTLHVLPLTLCVESSGLVLPGVQLVKVLIRDLRGDKSQVEITEPYSKHEINLFDSEHTIHAILQHNATVYVVVREPRVSLKETIDHLKSQALKGQSWLRIKRYRKCWVCDSVGGGPSDHVSQQPLYIIDDSLLTYMAPPTRTAAAYEAILTGTVTTSFRDIYYQVILHKATGCGYWETHVSPPISNAALGFSAAAARVLTSHAERKQGLDTN
ncbi:hypothetical protein B0H13DRAFT_1891813 [Mycena leptocephala]|nr:hypothetical protein B0H13DRAFT_1891813 [Mycena leptocephala]